MSGLPGWVTDPALATVWAAIGARLERNGLQTRGRVKVATPTRAQRQATGDLLGRTLTADAVWIDLGVLDGRLRERVAPGGMIEVLTALNGHPPRDRRAGRAALDAAREAPLGLAAELVDTPWAADWIAGLRQTGLLTNRDDAQRTVRDAAKILLELTGDPEPVSRSRVELGATMLGDAHALDRDRPLHQVVVRGLASAAGVGVPSATAEREGLWARFGVQADLLSRTCLVWGLRADSPRLRTCDPVHLTAWDLRRIHGLRAVNPVLICENPRVLEALVEREMPGWAAVCTSGEPNLVVDAVLRDLATSGASLFYHGDFDWPGIAIANRIMARVGARPWRLGAADYRGAVRPEGPALVGRPVEPSWDAELGATMRTHGRAVHEESVLMVLLDSMRHRD